ncbi:MAG TPA: head-tail connector protein, partial [Caulobacteraceae bacterium]
DAVSLAEARLFLRVTQDAEDELIALLIAAAQIRVAQWSASWGSGRVATAALAPSSRRPPLA